MSESRKRLSSCQLWDDPGSVSARGAQSSGRTGSVLELTLSETESQAGFAVDRFPGTVNGCLRGRTFPESHYNEMPVDYYSKQEQCL